MWIPSDSENNELPSLFWVQHHVEVHQLVPSVAAVVVVAAAVGGDDGGGAAVADDDLVIGVS